MRRILIGAILAGSSAAAVLVSTHVSAGQDTPPQPEAAASPTSQASDPTAGPDVIDLPGCSPTAAYEARNLNSLSTGGPLPPLRAVLWTERGGPAGESYFFNATEYPTRSDGLSPEIIDAKDGSIAYFWGAGSATSGAVLNGFRTDPSRIAVVAASLARGELPDGYVVAEGPVETSALRTWEFQCEIDGAPHAVHAIEGPAAARALYIAGSRHSAVLEETETFSLLEYGGDVPIRPASPVEWTRLLHTEFPEARP